MTGIVERLRTLYAEHKGGVADACADGCDDAADEIVALRDQIRGMARIGINTEAELIALRERLAAYGPLVPPSDDAAEVFAKTLERNPDADMRAIPNEWLLRERGISSSLNERLAALEAAARKVACWRCGEGAGDKDLLGHDCPDCADLRALLKETAP